MFLSLASDPANGGTLVLDNGAIAKYGSNAYSGGTDFPLVDEQDHRQNANLKVVIGKYGHIVCRGPMTVGELELDTNSRINLNGNVLAIRSRVHRNGRGWPSNWASAIVTPGGTDDNPGRIVWLPRPLALIVR